MTAREFFQRHQRDGRAYLRRRAVLASGGGRPAQVPDVWLINVSHRLVLCADNVMFPALRFVADDEQVEAREGELKLCLNVIEG
jgi:hypothetical protein